MQEEPKARARITLHDVAREAGVSYATASRAMHASTRKVNEAARNRVLAAAAKLSYTPNLSAQAVARGSTMTVALVVSDVADSYFSSIAAGVIGAADEAGLTVTMAVTGRAPERELEIVRTLRGQRPRMIIVVGSRVDDTQARDALVEELRAYEQVGGRVVMVSQPELPFTTVALENRRGAEQLATALAEHGYRRFAVIRGAEGLLTSRERVDGFVDGLTKAGIALDAHDVVESTFTRDGGQLAARTLAERGLGDIDLVFAITDVMAVGAMSGFRDAGIIPGRDVAVAGFDDIPMAMDVAPTLTTVAVPLATMGIRAVELALAEPAAVATETISTEVVLRDSTPARRPRRALRRRTLSGPAPRLVDREQESDQQ